MYFLSFYYIYFFSYQVPFIMFRSVHSFPSFFNHFLSSSSASLSVFVFFHLYIYLTNTFSVIVLEAVFLLLYKFAVYSNKLVPNNKQAFWSHSTQFLPFFLFNSVQYFYLTYHYIYNILQHTRPTASILEIRTSVHTNAMTTT